jgi:thiol-disulfide isomerase/thioredoxin
MSRLLPEVLNRPWLNALAMFCALAIEPVVFGEEEKKTAPAAEKSAEPAPEKKPEAEFDPFQIPETKELSVLSEYITKAMRWSPPRNTVDPKNKESIKAYQAEVIKARKNLVFAVDLAMTLNPDELQQKQLLQTKWSTLRMMGMMGDESDKARFTSFNLTILESGKGPLYIEAKKLQLTENIRLAADGKMKRSVLSAAEDVEPLLSSEETVMDGMMILSSSTYYVTMKGHYGEAKLMYDLMEKYIGKIKDEKRQAQVTKSIEDGRKKLAMIGQTIEIKAKKLDGSEFDLTSLRGKVVLIDFWATWCGPCIAEHPNVEAAYEKYHSKGFEVVAYSIDEDQEKLQKFIDEHKTPWVSLFNHDEDTRGFKDPLAKEFHVTGIPATYLIDASGKLVHFNVRGERLGQLLEEMLGNK